MFILCALFWLAVATAYPFSSSIMWLGVDIDLSNVDVVISLANGSSTDYLTAINTEADVHIDNMVITLPNSTVVNTGPMILYISNYHEDIYDIVMSAAGFTENFVESLATNALIISEQLQMNRSISQSFGGFVLPLPAESIDEESEDVDSGKSSILLKRYKADWHGCYMGWKGRNRCDSTGCHQANCYCKTNGYQRCVKTSHLSRACSAVACKNCVCKTDLSEWATNCVTQVTAFVLCCTHVILARKSWCRSS